MQYRYEYVREDDPMTLNDTYRVDLPKFGNLSSILLRISGNEISGLGQNGGAWRIMDFVSKIAIIGDGSEIVKSLSMEDADAAAFWDQLVMTPDRWRNYASNTQFAYCLLNFGRYKGDKEYGLDLGQFKNVELQITNTADGTKFTSFAVSALGLYLDETAARQFKGHFRTETWRSWTTVQDETKYLDLDVEYMIRRIILRAIPGLDGSNVANTGASNLMDNLVFMLDTGKIKLFDGGIDDLCVCNYFRHYAPVIMGGNQYMFADKGVNMGVGLVIAAVGGGGSQAGTGAAVIPTIESARTDFTQKPETYEADHPMPLIVDGYMPYNSCVLETSYDDIPSEYLDAKARAQVKLNIHTRNASSAAGGNNRVILDRLVPYPR